MAKMWPEWIPQEILSNPLRSSECKTFRRLEDELDDSFVVFYSRPWLGRKPSGEEIDGECDFIVAHPDLGILSLEVKGGQVEYFPERDEWRSRDRWGYSHIIKNPANQAMRCKHEILTKLNRSRLWKSRRISARHGVIFPDTENPGEDLRADLPLDIICFIDDFENNFNDWITRRFGEGGHPDTRMKPLGEDGMEALEDLLAKPFQLHVPIGHILAEDDRTIQILTYQQFHILRAIEKIPRALISGGAGTGKTVLAMEEAIKNAESGSRVLLTCYNRPLAEEMKRKLHTFSSITVSTFHELCRSTIHNAGLILPVDLPDNQLYNDIHPRYFIRALAMLPEYRFDTIIVDEGQDFIPLWLTALETVLIDSRKGKIRIFYDSNQRVYGNGERMLSEYELVPILLTYNIRNTENIHRIAQRYYQGFPIESIGPPGKKIEMVPIESLDVIHREIELLINRLLKQERINPADIAILAGSRNIINQISPSGYLAVMECISCDQTGGNDRIILDTVRRFKGLESQIVILVISPELITNDELLYVALSRARTHLIIIGDNASLEMLSLEE